jgi:hypothetical protein
MQFVDLPASKRRVGRPPRYAPSELISDLRRKGLSFREIARQTGFGYGTVRRAFLGVPTTSRAYLAGAAQADSSGLGIGNPSQTLALSFPFPPTPARWLKPSEEVPTPGGQGHRVLVSH